MFKNAAILLLVLSFQNIVAQIKLTHNIGDNVVETNMISCEEDESWARVFKLSDFGVTTNEQFIIRSGQVAISKSYNGANLGFTIYSVDSNFPNSSPVLLGSGGYKLLPRIEDAPQIIQFDFSEPFVVPAGVERILVEVGKIVDFYNPNSAEVIIAGTEEDTGISWYKGCGKYYTHTSTKDLDIPVPDANFYINVTGEKYSASNFGSNITLTHNFCDDIVKTMNHSCYFTYTYFARDFYLEDFGISTNEAFVINSGQVGISYSTWGASVQFNIYKIDDNFPASFSESDLIGSSQEYQFPYMGNLVRILDLDFEKAIVIPADVTRILVEVKKGIIGDSSALAHIAGTVQDDGAPSWYKGCSAGPSYINTDEIWPGSNYKLYINVKGQTVHTSNNFDMNITNICSEFLKEFSVEKKSEVASIVWNFGDLASGVNNTSTDLSPFHDFSTDGTYTITATVTANNGSVDILTETIHVKEPPTAYGINNIEACEDSFGTGISSSFDTSNVLSQVLGTQTDRVVTYIDGNGNEYNVLPNPFTNTVKDRETITVRVSRSEELCCYSEITFDLIVNPLPDLSNIEDVLACDDDNDGFTTFNLTQIHSDLSANNTKVDFYFQDGQQISNSQLNAVINKVKTQEAITVRVINTQTNCLNETTFKLIVNPLPIANLLQEITGCDDNGDGISEYFDTSTVDEMVMGNQTGMEVTYFDSNGKQLPSPLPNPYTNTVANQEIITVRVTNSQTGCYSETFLNLATSSKPQINQPIHLYACDEGNGIAHFNTSTIENQLIGNQTGLLIFYSDENGKALPSPLPTNYQNTEAWSQKINVRVENRLNPLCYSETSFNLTVNELPQINLENDYFLCDLEPSLYIATDSNFDSWKWTFEDGSVISNSFEVNLTDAGIYTLQITKINNGISCENSFSFNLVRSILPIIDEVKIQDISDNNTIEIITSGDGDFEYSIDGFNFQDDNIFQNLLGGVYNVQVRDKKGCGLDNKEVVLVDYPKFFTPNNDGFNDYWQIRGIEKFPNTIIYIFDRFGKLLKQLTFNDLGWDGTYNGQPLFASDYWFTADLGDGRTFKEHFSLKR
ncbi:MAG: hypothetical protein A3F91_05760 [Flavobacteria bacterium RIFCSPLOWO2_12_FULL_35_11]|nr:MAG: hypothetical protein A3F91_05760 [Flavobacteria bacterium RIFCSPLOWO2_12_FULL_35_11]